MISRATVRLWGAALIGTALACGGGDGGTGPALPTLRVIVGPDTSVPAGTPYVLTATVSDSTPSGAPWAFDIEWGDGQQSNGTTTTTTFTATHAFESEKRYAVRVTATNRDGAAGTGSFAVTATTPIMLAAGDIGDCLRDADDSTGAILHGLEGLVVALGDNAYLDGTPAEYENCYGPTWGPHKWRTRPVPGNHDYNTPGAAGYFGYFGAAAGDPAKGYYSYKLGSWFVIALNTGTEKPADYAAGSVQEQWLRAELASRSEQCVIALFHHGRFNTVFDRRPVRPEIGPLWDALYEYGVDLVLNGHDHAYQRFAPQRPDGIADPAFGIRQISVGTGGGETLYDFAPVPAGSNIEVRDNETVGVLMVTLRPGGYDWRFIRAAGGPFTDSGSGTCHGRPS